MVKYNYYFVFDVDILSLNFNSFFLTISTFHLTIMTYLVILNYHGNILINLGFHHILPFNWRKWASIFISP